MKSMGLVLSLVLVLSTAVSAQSSRPSPLSASANYLQLPLSFEPNRGQTDARVDFLARGGGYTLFLTPTEVLLGLTPRDPGATALAAVRMRLMGASPKPVGAGLDELGGKVNYFLGDDPKKWHADIPTYARVSYRGVYPGVDLVYYGNQGKLEYDFVVAAGADPTQIAFDFDGVDPQIDAEGNLVLPVAGGQVVFPKPVVYQSEKGSEAGRRLLDGRYVLRGKNQVAFTVAAYDPSKTLVIDPTLVYSTYLGASNYDGAFSVAVDGTGNAYITGGTVSSDFPVSKTGVFQSTYGGTLNPCNSQPQFLCGDVFVAKLNSSGNGLTWCTYLGGASKEFGGTIAVDAALNVYVAGATSSTKFPTTSNAYQPTFKGSTDGFLTKLNSSGSALLYSTFLGGSGDEQISGMAIDSSGNAFVTGNTSSTSFPVTPGVFQTVCNGCPTQSDVFVSKLNPSLSGNSSLVYSTFLGGSGSDSGRAIAVDSSGNAYVTGQTTSTDFPTQNAIQASFGGGNTSCSTLHHAICGDAFVTKLNSTATALIYSTYLGGSGEDSAVGMTIDAAGNAFVVGGTDSIDFPVTPGVLQPTFGGGSSGCVNAGTACGDAFVTKINAAGSAWMYSTYLGGSMDDSALRSAVVDSSDSVHVSGLTASANFPTVSAIQPNYGGGTTPCSPGFFCGDAFLATLNVTGTALVYSSFLGGTGDDAGFGLAVDSSGNNYVVGATTSANFPTTAGAFDVTCGTNGNCNSGTNGPLSDAFVTKSPALVPAVTFSPTSLTFSGQVVGTASASKPITLTNSGSGTLKIALPIIASGNYSETDTCPTTLNAGANCTLNVTFTPSVLGTISGEVTVNDSASSAAQVVNLSGTGSAPLSFSPTSLSFGTVTVGQTSAAKTVTVTNNQSTTLSFTYSASGNYSAVGGGTNPCTSSLAGGANCTISVTFSPSANGSINGVVVFTYTGVFTPLEISLSGTGTGGGTAPLTFNPTSLTFSPQVVGKTSLAKMVTVKNSSTSSLTISSFIIKPSGNYKIASGTCTVGKVLTAGSSCNWMVTFTPSVNGTTTGSIVITDTAAISKQVFNLSGTGILPVSFSPTSLTFAAQSVGTLSAAQSVTLTNNQSTTLTITGMTASGDYIVASGGTTPCGSTVAGKGTCTFIVTFAPTAKGTVSGVATITHNAADSPQVVTMTGTGQ